MGYIYLKGFSFLVAFFFLISCSNKIVRAYGNGIDSQPKSLSGSVLELRKDKTFTLTRTTTIFEYAIPQGGITEIVGTYNSKSNSLLLMPIKQRVSWVEYGPNSMGNQVIKENPGVGNIPFKGVRATAIVAIDTTFGDFQDIKSSETLEFVKHVRPNSIYFINGDECFYTYINSDISHDLKNYCSDFVTVRKEDK